MAGGAPAALIGWDAAVRKGPRSDTLKGVLEIAWPVLFIALMGMLLKFTDFSAVLLLAIVATGVIWLADAKAFAPRRAEGAAEPIVVDMARAFFPVIVVVFLIRSFWVEPFKIPSGSMIPTLMIGDHIFVAKYAYGPLLPRSDTRLYDALPPERGDVMVFKFPENKQQDFIKRAIALPGDRLEAIDGRPVINGWLVPNCKVGKIDMPHGVRGHLYMEYLGDKSYLTMFDEALPVISCTTDDNCRGGRSCRGGVCGLLQGPYDVAEGEVWVMGDNRNNSHDSRSWHGGMGDGVPFENIKGRAMFVWWSWDPQGGVALDRIFVNVMGTPKLPPGTPPELTANIDKCYRERPPVSETTPPSRR